MSVDEQIQRVTASLSHLDGFRIKKMFGGASVYSEEVVFCMITRDGIPHFRIGEENIEEYKVAGMKPFAPKGRQSKMIMPYYTVPEGLWEDQEKLEQWVEKALVEAKSAKKKK